MTSEHLLPVSEKQVRLGVLRAMDTIDRFTTYDQLDKYRGYLNNIVFPQLRHHNLFTRAHVFNSFISDRAIKLIGKKDNENN